MPFVETMLTRRYTPSLVLVVCHRSPALRARLLTQTTAPQPASAAHVAAGTMAFIMAERGTAAALAAFDSEMPASVVALCALGTLAAVPAAGAPLQHALGPAAAWLRAALPWLTAPAFLYPAVVVLPESDALTRLALFCTGGAVATCAVTGHVAAAFAQTTAPPSAVPSAACAAAAATAYTSPWTALRALSLGVAATAALCWLRPPSDAASTAVARAPVYASLTFAFHGVAVRVLPAPIRAFLPPNVGSGLLMLSVCLAVGGLDEVRVYLAGAGAALLWLVQPAMITLGLYSYTHAAVVAHQARAMLALAVVSPALLFGLAWTGAAMGLAPAHIASALPASTTTGLALTMPSGMSLIQREWVAAGTAFNSALTQCTLPVLLGATALSSKQPFSRGAAIGCTGHVGGMVALVAAGEMAAADAAAVAIVICGGVRGVLRCSCARL